MGRAASVMASECAVSDGQPQQRDAAAGDPPTSSGESAKAQAAPSAADDHFAIANSTLTLATTPPQQDEMGASSRRCSQLQAQALSQADANGYESDGGHGTATVPYAVHERRELRVRPPRVQKRVMAVGAFAGAAARGRARRLRERATGGADRPHSKRVNGTDDEARCIKGLNMQGVPKLPVATRHAPRRNSA